MDTSLLHILLERIAWKIWHVHEDHRVTLTGDLPLKQLITKLQKSVKESPWSQDPKRILFKILKDSESIIERRNKLLHALWIIEDGKPVFCYKRKEGVDTSQSLGTIKQLSFDVSANLVAISKFKEEFASIIPS